MAMKRQRGSDDSYRCLSSFGKEFITELIKEGNPTFTRGAFGTLSVGIQKSGPQENCHYVAIKTIERALVLESIGTDKTELSEDVIFEVAALGSLTPHENIVSLVGLYAANSMSKSALSLVFPYTPCDLQLSLEWRRRTFRPLLPSAVIKTIAGDISAALLHCHESGWLHRDVKPGNLLVTSTGVVKLCDFGIAKPFLDESKSAIKPSETETGSKGLCTLFYRPPEVLFGGSAAEPSVDMYSAGAVIAELVTGRALFPGQSVLAQLSLIFDLLGTPTEMSWPSVESLPDYGKLTFAIKEPQPWENLIPRITEDKDLYDMLSQLVTLDPNKRLSSKETLGHPWLVSPGKEPAPRHQLRKELIPSRLREPPLLDPSNLSTASKMAMKLAERRRTFFNSPEVNAWTGPDIVKESIESVCLALERDFQRGATRMQVDEN